MNAEPRNAPLSAAALRVDPARLAGQRLAGRQRVTPAATAVALAATLGLAAACWLISVWQMSGMNMGTATQLGPFWPFLGVWVAMMAAMMLPGVAPVALRRAQAGLVSTVPLFVGAYLAVWALIGVIVSVAYRPHGTVAAGAVVLAAAVYELTPLKRHFRRRCSEATGSGFEYGLCCAGATLGLMAMLVALGVMSLFWMVVIAIVILAQKILPVRAVIDVPVALAIAGLGVLILTAPAMVPGLSPPM